MTRKFCVLVALFLAAGTGSVVWAQDSFLERWQSLRDAQPEGVALHIAAPKLTFYLGETVPLVLSFTATEPRTFVADSRLQDRIGRLNGTDEFVADPIASSEDPLRGLPGEAGGLGGISGGNAILSPDKPFLVQRNLNEWVRFRTPGTYRIYVLSRRARQVTGTGNTDLQLQAFAGSKAIEVVSDIVTLEVVAAPSAWIAQEIATSTAVLDSAPGNNPESVRSSQQAGLALRFLNTVESGVALAKRLPAINSVDAFAVRSGILDSSHRAALLPALEKLLTEPAQGISEQFLIALAQLAVLVDSRGVLPPYPSEEAARQAWQKESKRRSDLFVERRDYYVSILVKALGDKEPAARALTSAGLLSVAESYGIRPAWQPSVVDYLIAVFRTLPLSMQSNLLDDRWRLLRDREVLPLLNDLYANPPRPDSNQPSLDRLVLRRIYELRPEQGRQLILQELHGRGRSDVSTLMMLPDENLPELNEVFAAQIARGGPLPTLLITRYATGEIVKDVERGYLAFNAELDRQKLPHCPYPLLFYFLKFDPEFGEQELRKAFATGPCYDIGRGLESLGAHAMSPALERLAIEYLTSGIVTIKRGAAEVLGKYGSPASRKPLWETMEYFHTWWKGREDDLRKPVGQESMFLERALRTALGQAGGWVLGEAELRRLLALCSSGECQGSVNEWIASAGVPKPVEITSFFNELRIKVGQYTLAGERELPAKLAQFPAGTAFRIAQTRSEEATLARPRVEAAIGLAGHTIVP